MTQPRPEYPRPQFVRQDWLNLNGQWDFAIGGDRSPVPPSQWVLPAHIVVPFAPESTLSGISERGFMNHVRYRKHVCLPPEWRGQRVLLHFGAVDHDATVYVDDQVVGRHRGGFTSFTVEITAALDAEPDFVLSLDVYDDPCEIQARGKQSQREENYEAFYTRTTGIWQTVWAEPVPEVYMRSARVTPNLDERAFSVVFDLSGARENDRVSAELLLADGTPIATGSAEATQQVMPEVRLNIPEEHLHVWAPGSPHLYRTRFTVTRDHEKIDEAEGYAGLRSVGIDGTRVLLNGSPVFQRLVLDQGYWPDGIMTAPSDEALKQDIRIGLAAGFNGARLHQKVFEERYLYHADTMGYLVWAEFGDWGANRDVLRGEQSPSPSFIAEWLEAVARDYSHPSIIGWCPLNETYQPITERLTLLDDVTKALYLATKLADPTRPVLDASGYSHRVDGADVYDSHDYEQDPEAFRAHMQGLAHGSPFVNRAQDGTHWSVPYANQPYFVSEFGGIWWADGRVPGLTSWGYGQAPSSRSEWMKRFRGLVDTLLDDPRMFGYCFTQLTDVFQEENGIYDFQRRPKFDVGELKKIQTRPAAFEQSSKSQ